jgi:hypothetical protein
VQPVSASSAHPTIECAQPGEEVGVLRVGSVARQRLVEMVVAVDQPWQEDLATEVEHFIRCLWEVFGWANHLDFAISREEASVPQFSALAVHRHQNVRVVRKQRCHRLPRCLLTSHSGA